MKKLELSQTEAIAMLGILEALPAKNIGELRLVDKICKKIEAKTFEFEDAEFEIIKEKVLSCQNLVARKEIRETTLSLADKLV